MSASLFPKIAGRTRLAIASAWSVATFALGAISLSACSEGSRNEGTRIEFVAQAQALRTVQTDGAGKQFANSEGTSILLRRALITVSKITLSTDCNRSGFVHLQRFKPTWDWFIPVAHAHVSESPTSIGAPTVIDMLEIDGEPQSLGFLSPPVQDYCGTQWDVFAADDDAANLPSDFPMVGLSIALEGHFGTEETPFSIRSAQSLRPAQRLFPALLMLSAQQRTATVSMDWNYDRWFDGLDLGALSRGDAATINSLLLAVTEHTRIRVKTATQQ